MRNLKRRQKHKPVKTTQLPFTGNLQSPILMVVDPIVGNLNAKTPLNAKQLQWFVNHLKEHGGFKKEDICIVSASTPVDHETWGQNKLISNHLKEWRDELLKIIDRNKPKLIMPFGAKACQQVFGKSVQITKVRGQPVQELGICHNTPVLPMLSPFYAQRQPENEASFAADMQTAGRIHRANYDLDKSAIDYKHDYQWCWDARKLWKLLRNKRMLSVDVETVGLQGFAPDTKLLTIQFCYEEGKSVIVPIDYDKGELRYHNFIPWKRGMRQQLIRVCKRILENPNTKVFGQNFKFDWLMLWYMLGIEVANYSDDIQLLAHLLDENSRGLNIDDLVRRYAPSMAGFNDCVAPHTRILKADHTWVAASDIKEGDELIGFDEYTDSNGASPRKKLRRSIVKSVKRRIKPGYRITYGSGRILEVSDNHELLFKRGPKGGGNYWRMARDLKGDEIPVTFPFKPNPSTNEEAWLGGFLDGEGYCVNHGNKGMRLGFSQNENPALHKAIEVSNNITDKPMYVGLPSGKSCYNAVVAGWSALEVLQQCPTHRLRYKTTWEGMAMPQPIENDHIYKIESIGEIETVSIETSTHTFIAEGVASHNCYNNDPDHHGKTRMDLLPPEKMLPYGCGDTDAVWRLLPVLKKQVWADQGKNASLRDTYEKVTMPAQRAFCYIELNGFPVSHDELNAFQRKLKRIQKRERIYLLSQIPKSIKNKHKDTGVGLKVNRGVILRDWLYDHPDGLRLKPVLYTKTKQPSVSSKEALPYYVADHPVVARLIDYIKNDKLLHTYAEGFHKYIYDGLIRPSYGLTGTVTGRSMCFVAGTQVTVLDERGSVSIENVKQGDWVWGFDKQGCPTPTEVTASFKTKTVTKLAKVVYRTQGRQITKVLKCTPDHKFRLRDGSYVEAQNLERGHRLMSLEREVTCKGYRRVYATGNEAFLEHRAIAGKYAAIDNKHVHHVDSSKLNNRPDNLEPLTPAEHLARHPWSADRKGKLSATQSGKLTVRPIMRGEENPRYYEIDPEWIIDQLEQYKFSLAEYCRANGRDYSTVSAKFKKDGYDPADAGRESKRRYQQRVLPEARKAIRIKDAARILKTNFYEARELLAFDNNHEVLRVEIYDCEPTPVYDITTPETSCFVANGVCVHNSRDPNGQNFPKRGKLAKEYRKVFKAPPGWVFVACDLSQAELRIAAMMSGDPNMLAVYKSGGDIHRTTAAGTMGISVEEFLKLPKDVQGLKRFQAKAINFGFLYGMWWVKFRSYAKTEYGIDFTEKEAEEIRTKFFKTYPMLEDWHRDVQEYVAIKGRIRAYNGRLRHLPNVFSDDQAIAKQAMRQAINSPVQSIASDLGLMTLGRLVPYIREKGYDWIKLCGFIHDAIVCLVREDKVARGCSLVKWFMESNPLKEWFNWSPEVPIVADAEIGRTLAETVELEPSMFEGKHNEHKTFDDLVKEATEKDDDKSSTIKTKRRKIKLKRSKHNAQNETSQRTDRSHKPLRKTVKKSQRRIKRGKSSKDRAA